MELLLALDFVTIKEATELLREVRDFVDIVEVGTPLVVREGLRAVEALRREFPGLPIMADLKIMDAGEYETRMAIEAGADIVTVLGVADDATIRAAVAAARRSSKGIMVDLIGATDAPRRAREIEAFEADYLCVHTASDLQTTGESPIEMLRRVMAVGRRTKIAVAGGIRLDTIGEIVPLGPDIIIVGGGIAGRPDPREAAIEMKRIMSGQEK